MARNLLQKKSIKYGGESREKVMRVPFGLGAPPGDEKAAEKCLRCGFGNVPVVEEVVWTIPLPLTAEQAQTTFGDTVNPLSGSSAVPGVASIDSTFLINGILQTDILAQGIGVHVFCEPSSFSTIGNAWAAPTATAPPPPSPDVWTTNDILASAMGAGVNPLLPNAQAFVPAVFEWGAATWRAGWNFINAYQLQLRTNQRELMINEMLADVAYFASFGDAIAAGTSEVAVIEYAAIANERYRAIGSPTIFLPANFRRYGSVGTSPGNNQGLYHATRDFDFAPATRGGIKFTGTSCHGSMYRKVEKPCFFERGIPIGMQMVVVDPVHQARFQAAMSVDSFTGSQNLQPDVNVTGYTLLVATSGPYEQTLDLVTPTNIAQAITVERQAYKGGIFKLGVKLKGWEMPGAWKSWCQKNLPQLLAGSSAAPSGSTAMVNQ